MIILLKVVLPKNEYWGSGVEKADNEAIVDFKIHVSDGELTDLKNRLVNSRIGHTTLEDVKSFEYGVNTKALLDIKNYWLNKYDWKKQEAMLNAFPQFKTQIEGLNIHYIHAKPPKNKYTTVYPLLMVHGWPGSVLEFYKLIPMLTDPATVDPKIDFAFELIVPSLPGYGFSDSSKKSGLNQLVTARIFKKLLSRLGHGKAFVAGTDWGSLVVSNLARFWPEHCKGLHITMAFVQPSTPKQWFYTIAGNIAPSLVFKNPLHHNYSTKRLFMNVMKESGYMHIQATKPDTVGVSLNDSPLGLAAYILEKFSTWTDPRFVDLEDGGLTKYFTMDELLTNVMIYWTQGNIVNSQRYYKEHFRDQDSMEASKMFINVPTGYAAFPHDIGERLPEEIFQLSFNMLTYNDFKGHEGGHFAAFQAPKLVALDVINFVKQVIYFPRN
uniref:Epoxide hydrolase n=1 Tax=Rhabditophanes sp. KR3021 TaxID=114890 RepID=A0AC35UF37_9BILA